MPSPSPSQHVLFPWGGAVCAGPTSAVAAPPAAWVVHPFGLWDDPADDARASAGRGTVRRPEALGDRRVYLNFIGDEGPDRVIAGFGQENYDRLSRVKCEYDPDNVFRLNQNILPGWPEKSAE